MDFIQKNTGSVLPDVDLQVRIDVAIVRRQMNQKKSNGRYTGDAYDAAPVAACSTVDPDLFFSSNPKKVAEAKAVCAGCEMRSECVTMNADIRQGIWGGEERS